ncbi:WhiB family transcriptional regulator [Streptomyces sp. NPDC010273]|uniref:WhiB family transcriptional regulator n=1 Tax=Streptomyces sp. NPDC010273 TaxID=3364829 RepID=UPI0036E40C23
MTNVGRPADPKHWQVVAACSGSTRHLFHLPNSAAAQQICRGCPVRAECLHDALDSDAPTGIWGGLSRTERKALPVLPADRAAALAELRLLLAELSDNLPPEPEVPVTIRALQNLLTDIDSQGGPQAARDNRLHLTTDPQGAPHPMTTDSVPPALPTPAPAATAAPAQVPVGKLLKWGDDHAEAKVRKQAAVARAALTDLRTLHAADQELLALAAEAEQLKQRLAQLEARQVELAPRSRKKPSHNRDYDAREVRAWASAAGVDCPRVGQVPRAVLDAWRAATSPTVSTPS